jgi:hypothetical protein
MRRVEGLVPDAYDRTLIGVVVSIPGSSVPGVNVQGNVIQARWTDPIVAAPGDTVLVQLIITKSGLAEAIVKGKITTGPRPERATVTVVPASSPTITVQGTDGVNYTAKFVTSYTPTVGDLVYLSWFGTQATVVGKVASTAGAAPPPAPAPPAPPPPPPPVTGSTPFAATGSSTFWGPGGWDSWAGGRGRVYQGQYGSGQVYGAWFYGGSPGQLAGRTITRLRIQVGNRIQAGNWGSAVTIHFYLHTNSSKPGQFTDVTRTAGPSDGTAYPNQGLTTYDLPTSWAATVIAGGGIGLALDPYAGFLGAQEQPDSGKLIFDWSS